MATAKSGTAKKSTAAKPAVKKTATSKASGAARSTAKSTKAASTTRPKPMKIPTPPALAKAGASVRAAFKAGAKDAKSLGEAMSLGWKEVKRTHEKSEKTGKWVKKAK